MYSLLKYFAGLQKHAVLFSMLLCHAAAQSEGDVRISSGNQKTFGRLEIYLEGKWSTFCGLSRGGAQAACRQLGFIDYLEYYPYELKGSSAVEKASPETPIAIITTFCAYKSSNGPLHVLGCGISRVVQQFPCNHDRDQVIRCKNESLWERPYDTQVRLNYNTYPSSGTLEIYLDNEWGNICSEVFDKGAADSACLQMGYSGSSLISVDSLPSLLQVWLVGASCNTSCSCFRNCFGAAPVYNHSCVDSSVVYLSCTYDIHSHVMEPGSEAMCSDPKKALCEGSSPSLSFGMVMLLCIAVLVVALITAALSALCLFSTRVYEKVNPFE